MTQNNNCPHKIFFEEEKIIFLNKYMTPCTIPGYVCIQSTAKPPITESILKHHSCISDNYQTCERYIAQEKK